MNFDDDEISFINVFMDSHLITRHLMRFSNDANIAQHHTTSCCWNLHCCRL